MAISRNLLFFVLFATILCVVHAALYTSSSELPRLSSYDYVVVGGGTAGSVISARLSEDPKCQVLVLEAGGSDEGILAATVPFLGPTLAPSTVYDWNYTTTAQPNLDGRSVLYSCGHVLGGSSTINYMAYTRGPADDFNKYAEIVGDSGWEWDSLSQVIPRHEHTVPPTDGRPREDFYDPSVHGTNGTLATNVLPNSPALIDQVVIDASKELGGEFGWTRDLNGGKALGIGYIASTTANGCRQSAASAYLHPNIHRPNLHVLVNAQVTELIKTGTRNGLPVFNALKFQSDRNGPLTRVDANAEIIISAGSFGTPTLLQQSGIGDPEDLTPAGIETVVDLPSVGKNLSDHIYISVIFKVNGSTYDPLLVDPNAFGEAMKEWQTNKTGPLSNAPSNTFGLFRLPTHHPIFKSVPDPGGGPGSAHYEVIFVNFHLLVGVTPEPGNYVSFLAALVSSTSRGTVKVTSKDPWVYPHINPNYLSTEWDRVTIREAVKAAFRFTKASAWTDWGIEPYGASATLTSDEKIDAYARKVVQPIYHAASTAAMSPAGADWGVVNPDLKVKKVEGLRIMDASILPFVPSAHTQAPVYLMAERAADIIKASPEFRGLRLQRDEL